MAVFVTGATGFLGTEVVSSLLRSTDEIIYVLVRAEDEEAATHRLKSFWYEKKRPLLPNRQPDPSACR